MRVVSFQNRPLPLILLLWLLVGQTAEAQSVWYDISVRGKVIGTVKVFSEEQVAGRSKRTITSTFHVPHLYSGIFESTSMRRNGILVETQTVHATSKGKVKEKTRTRLSGTAGYQIAHYKADTLSPVSTAVVSEINHTLSDLYYAEPKGIHHAYSERYGASCSIRRIDQNKYGITLPTGKTSVYTYNNGVCQQVELELAGIRLTITKRAEVNLALNDSK